MGSLVLQPCFFFVSVRIPVVHCVVGLKAWSAESRPDNPFLRPCLQLPRYYSYLCTNTLKAS